MANDELEKVTKERDELKARLAAAEGMFVPGKRLLLRCTARPANPRLPPTFRQVETKGGVVLTVLLEDVEADGEA